MNKATIDVGDAIADTELDENMGKTFKRHHLLSKAQWSRLSKLLENIYAGRSHTLIGICYEAKNPTESLRRLSDVESKDKRGRPKAGNQAVFKSALWMIRHENATWDDLPRGYRKKTACWTYLCEWMNTGLDARIKGEVKRSAQFPLFSYSLWDLLCVTYINSLIGEKWARWCAAYSKTGYSKYSRWREFAMRNKGKREYVIRPPYNKQGKFDIDAMKIAFWIHLSTLYYDKDTAYEIRKYDRSEEHRPFKEMLKRMRPKSNRKKREIIMPDD